MAGGASDPIASSTNQTLKLVRSLQRRKHRQQERAFIVEGVRATIDFLESGLVPRVVLLRQRNAEALGALLPPGTPVRVVTDALFDEATDTMHPQGILGVFDMPEDAALPETSLLPCVAILDAVRDPGNVGTLIRSAAAAGMAHVIIGPGCADPWHPKVVRAGMGAHAKVPISTRDWSELSVWLKGFGTIAIAEAAGTAVYDSVNWISGVALIIGGEARGPSEAARRLARTTISIPLANGVESLNAAVAGSVLMFEAARQLRRAARDANR